MKAKDNKLIIFEGLDNTGKSTIREYAIQCGLFNSEMMLYHCGKPDISSKDWEQIAKAQDNYFYEFVGQVISDICLGNNDICLDRAWFGEYVYGQLYRHRTPESIKSMIDQCDKLANKMLGINKVFLFTFVADPEFCLRNEDGDSLSENDVNKIAKEKELFEEITKYSLIKHKKIIKVNDGDNFRSKEDILNEIKETINEHF